MAPVNALVTRLARNYLQRYVKIDLQKVTPDIQLANQRAVIQISGVELQKDALKSYDIPVEVSAGVVRRLTLTYPLTFFR